jgi:PAS domain S-box-containing protein
MSERNKQELESIRQSEEKYRQMIELANDAIFSIDPDDGAILEVNLKAVELTGYSSDELVGMKVWDLHPVEDREEACQLFNEVVATGRGQSGDMCCNQKQGGVIHIAVSASVITYGDKKVIQRICHDITNRRTLEQKTLFLRQYYEAILDMMPIGLGVLKNVDKKAEFEFENKQLQVMFADASKAGCSCCWHESGQSEKVRRRPVLNANGIYAEEREFPNNQVFMFTSSYFRDLDGSWRELHIVQDVTERHRLEKQLHRAKTGLEQKVEERTRELRQKQTQLVQAEKMASLGNLMAGIAHEINTPLGAIKCNHDVFRRSIDKVLEILNTQDADDGQTESERLIQLIENAKQLNSVNQEATERIARIVRSSREFARLDQAEMDTVDLHEGIENTLILVNHALKNRVEVVRDYGRIPQVTCYPNQLNQVYMNILVNAGQAIEGKGTIHIRTAVKNDSVVIEFKDSGRGMSTDTIKHIFDPGFTTKGSGVGTGLGLSIVYQIIQDHKGEIEVESEPGKGTTFRLTLPIALK